MRESIGSFTLIKNEILWIEKHLETWLPYLDQMVFFDCGSTDGTLETVKKYLTVEHGKKIKLFEDKDPVDLKDDYVRVFNECLHSLDTDLAMYIHPDMIAKNPEELNKIPQGIIAGISHMVSFAGELDGQVYQIVKGRDSKWKNIYRLKNPDLGAHFFGWYGAYNEDIWYREISGDDYFVDIEKPIENRVPYELYDSGLIVFHYSDIRPYERRLQRMKTCLEHQGREPEEVELLAPNHPRVNLKSNYAFTLNPVGIDRFWLSKIKEKELSQC